jgi:hypothetical protein
VAKGAKRWYAMLNGKSNRSNNMSKEVVVTIARDGEVVIEANNFQGVGCKAATKDLELVLAGAGTENKDTKPKPDFYARTTGSAKVNN